MLQLKKYLPLLIVGMLLFTSCKDVITKDENTSKNELTSEQLKLKENLKKASLAINDLLSNKEAAKELKFSIEYYRDKYNTDERVTFRKLFDPNSKYKKQWKNKTSFAEAFRNLNKKKSKSNNIDYNELEEFLKDKNITIYFPYSKNWTDENILPTLTYHPIDNEHRNEGFKPIGNQQNSAKVTTETVTVDDAYAQQEPTYIVAPCDGGSGDACLPGGGGGGGSGSGGGDDDSSSCVEGEECAHKVQIGWAMLKTHYDGLFAGGSEIRWKSVDAIKHFESSDPELKKIGVPQYFSRDQIANDTWVKVFTQFDQNWEEYELAKDFKVYEADGGGLTSIELGVKVDMGPVQPNFGVEFNPSNDRDNIFQTTYQRDVFSAENDMDLGHGLKEGVQIRHAGELYWTMPITEIGL